MKRLNKILKSLETKTAVRIFNEKAEIDMSQIILAVITLFVGGLLWGAIGGTGIQSAINSRNASWASNVLNTYDAIPIIMTVSGLMIFVAVIIKLSRS